MVLVRSFFTGCKRKVASSRTCLKILPLLLVLSTCGNPASHVHLSPTGTGCHTHLVLRSSSRTLIQQSRFPCCIKGTQQYPILCISLSKIPGKVKQMGKMVKAAVKPKAGFQELVQCILGARLWSYSQQFSIVTTIKVTGNQVWPATGFLCACTHCPKHDRISQATSICFLTKFQVKKGACNDS